MNSINVLEYFSIHNFSDSYIPGHNIYILVHMDYFRAHQPFAHYNSSLMLLWKDCVSRYTR